MTDARSSWYERAACRGADTEELFANSAAQATCEVPLRRASGSGAPGGNSGGTGLVPRGRSGSLPHPLVTGTQLRAYGGALKRGAQ